MKKKYEEDQDLSLPNMKNPIELLRNGLSLLENVKMCVETKFDPDFECPDSAEISKVHDDLIDYYHYHDLRSALFGVPNSASALLYPIFSLPISSYFQNGALAHRASSLLGSFYRENVETENYIPFQTKKPSEKIVLMTPTAFKSALETQKQRDSDIAKEAIECIEDYFQASESMLDHFILQIKYRTDDDTENFVSLMSPPSAMDSTSAKEEADIIVNHLDKIEPLLNETIERVRVCHERGVYIDAIQKQHAKTKPLKPALQDINVRQMNVQFNVHVKNLIELSKDLKGKANHPIANKFRTSLDI